MPKISWGDARQILENLVGDWKDSNGAVTKTAHLSSDWLDRDTAFCRDDSAGCSKGKHDCLKGVETDRTYYTSPYSKFVVGFIDDSAEKHWPHACRYVFISLDGCRLVINSNLPPKSMIKYRFEQVIPPPDYERIITVRAKDDEKW